MAKSYSFEDIATYQDTQTYRQASPERRRQINRYKKENDITDEHMLYLMLNMDLDAVPQQERENDNTLATVMLVIGVLLLWNTLQAASGYGSGVANVGLIFLSLASFGLVCVVYFTGMLSPYKRAVRQVAKALKGRPEVPDFTTWDIQHPDKTDRKSKRR